MKQISAAIAVVLAATFVAIAGSSPPASALAPAAAPSSAQADGCSMTSREYAMMMDAHNRLASVVYAMKHDVAELRGESFSDCVPLDEHGEPIVDPDDYYPGKSQEELASQDITYSLVLVTADFHCPPCEVAKNQIAPWLESHGWEVTECDGGYGVNSFPTWIVLREGTECHRWSGAAWSRAGRATVIQHLRTAKGELEVAHTPSLRDWINSHYTPGQHLSWGVSGMSVRSHLQDGSHGNHIWRDEQIDGLSEWEMLCLHDATHRGLTHPGEW